MSAESASSRAFYKQVWFWIIVVVVVLGIAGGTYWLGQDKVEKIDSNGKVTKVGNDALLKVGDVAKYDGVEYKVNSVKINGIENDEDEDVYPVVVNVTIINHSKKAVKYDPQYFQLDANGKKAIMETKSPGVKDLLQKGEIDGEGVVTGNLVANADPEAKMKLTYSGDMFKGKSVTFLLKNTGDLE